MPALSLRGLPYVLLHPELPIRVGFLVLGYRACGHPAIRGSFRPLSRVHLWESTYRLAADIQSARRSTKPSSACRASLQYVYFRIEASRRFMRRLQFVYGKWIHGIKVLDAKAR